MFTCASKQGTLQVDFENGYVASLFCDGEELVSRKEPLFVIRLRNTAGDPMDLTAFDAAVCTVTDGVAVYSGFAENVTVTVSATNTFPTEWRIAVKNETDRLVEWVEFPRVGLKPLKANGGVGRVLLPYNEGVVVEDAVLRQNSWFPHEEPDYPSKGSYYMFPNMLSSQFLCYLFEGKGLYLGAHDTARGVKALDFYPVEEGITVTFRHFCGCEYGADPVLDFPVVWELFEGDWQDGAEIYRTWFEQNLPHGVVKVKDNPHLPAWYKQSPLVITYPVRGVHDMDKMDPNALFPYCNALPLIDEIAEKTGSPILVLLMHWEGTAPWAPPYVWPPYGGEEPFNEFLEKLHERGHLLGVYCSGFGWTLKSNLVDEYDNTDVYNAELETAMCASPAGKVEISRICTGQRSGYDICPVSKKGKEILNEAYRPLLESDVDYVQILDQNHGGGQYFCYSRDHGHPPAPGTWMTEKMNELLDEWQERGGMTLFGCESASSEAFMAELLYSDNRYALGWHIGEPVPLYAYLYHEYLRNFQGNHVACPFTNEADTMCCRMAYSFAAGDSMTLVVTPFGELMNNWGYHDFSNLPDKERALRFAANLRRFYEGEAGPYLYDGRMIKPCDYAHETVSYPAIENRTIAVPCVYSSAWEKDGKQVQVFVNHTLEPQTVTVNGSVLTVPALDAVLMAL